VSGGRGAAARLGWCYGDPGVVSGLLLGARGAGRPDWEAQVLAVARNAATVSTERSRVLDAGMCHGASGLGHVFARLFNATGEDAFLLAARRWYAQALSMRHEGARFAGFQARTTPLEGSGVFVDDPTLLTGALGVGLSLLAAATAIEPKWDRPFVTCVPIRAAGSPAPPTPR
jgi:hypothetical protein